MARKSFVTSSVLVKKKVRRKGVHAKTKTSKLKASKHYKKTYKGCLCDDNTYHPDCCDGTLWGQGVGRTET